MNDDNGWTKRWWILALSGVTLIIIVLTIFVFPLKEVENTVTELQPVSETYYETETQTSVQDKSRYLFADIDFELVKGKKIFSTEIDLANKATPIITGYILLRDRSVEYYFYIVDEADYSDHLISIEYPPDHPYIAIVPPDHDTDNSFSFIPDHSDTYYFVFNIMDINPDYHFGGLIEFGASWEWQETVVETIDVQKERTVMKEVEVVHYEKVTLWDYFMNY